MLNAVILNVVASIKGLVMGTNIPVKLDNAHRYLIVRVMVTFKVKFMVVTR